MAAATAAAGGAILLKPTDFYDDAEVAHLPDLASLALETPAPAPTPTPAPAGKLKLPRAMRALVMLLAKCTDIVPWVVGSRSGVGFVADVPLDAAAGDEEKEFRAAYSAYLAATGTLHEGVIALEKENPAKPGTGEACTVRHLIVHMNTASLPMMNTWLAELSLPLLPAGGAPPPAAASALAADAPRVRDSASGGAGGVHLPVTT